jgi:hypothetical protein
MIVQASHVITMLHVLRMKVLLYVNVMLGILEMDLIVLVRKSFICVSKIFYFLSMTYWLLFI